MKRAALALVLAASTSARAEELTVFAASSLREAFAAIAQQVERAHPGTRVSLSFAGSQELRVQIENGATADVFASADVKHMEALRRQGLAAAPRIFARNEPVLVVPADNPAGVQSFADLPRATRIVLGAAAVPIGAYSEQILEKAGLRERVLPRVVSRELNVRQVLAKVAIGEADAGIVYRSDARQGGVRTIAIPPAVNVTAEYPIAALTRARHPRLAAAFVQAVLSPEGQAALRGAGFTP